MELRARPMELRVVEAPARPFVAVLGLAPRCGASTVARALAAHLARRDHSGVAIVAGPDEPVGSAVAARATVRLSARLAASGIPARASGRLCLARTHDVSSLPQFAPLVLDLPNGDSATTAAAQTAILVAPGDSEPALAELAAQAMNAVTVVTHADDPGRWDGRALLVVPHSRLGARLAAAGWEPRGALAAAVERIAEAACA